MALRFTKMHGCGNDFVVLDARAEAVGLSPAWIAAMGDRRRGIGFDQLVLIEPAQDADAALSFFNPDGSEAGACGNGTRCAAALLGQQSGHRRLRLRTRAGLLEAEIQGGCRVAVNMGQPSTHWRDVPLAEPMDTLHLDLACGPVADPAALSIGNPHATFFVPDLDAVPAETIGPALERNRLFPERANIGFAQVLAPDRLRLRVWERGAGLTLACGSGACAAAVNAHRRGLTGRRVRVQVDGGELEIEWLADNSVLMTGPAETAFVGEVRPEALA